jgi:eukaryotic-like serine/threonine-protein kinase
VTAQPSTNDALLVDRYFLFREIAAGGMASIHLARLLGPVGFGRTVAVKRLHAHYARESAFVAMFLDEANIMTSIRHPNVVPVLDVVALPGQLFLVMEYVHGDSLSRLAATGSGKVPPPILSAVAIDTLDGLHAAHEARGPGGTALGVIHRDVSPQNILVGVDGHARVVDFGIAKATSQLHETTAAGGHKGKLKYMAPEQLDGRPADRRVDIWAAGVVFWELLTGQRLFGGDNDGVLIHRILEMEIPKPSSISPNLASWDDVIMKALSRTVEDRFPDARSMAVALEAACPPAATREVSRWVEEAGVATLRERQEILDELDVVARSGLPSVRSQLAVITDQAAVSGIVGAVPSERAIPDDATRPAGGRPTVRGSTPSTPSSASLPVSVSPASPVSEIQREAVATSRSARPVTPRRGALLAGVIAAGVALPILAVAASLALTRRAAPAAAATATTSPASLAIPTPSVASAETATTASSPPSAPTPTVSGSPSARPGKKTRPGAPDDGIRLDRRK